MRENESIVNEIQEILSNDKDGLISHKELAKKYGLHKDTIRNINVGRTWYNDKYTYPLHISKQDNTRKEKNHNYCVDCGKEIFISSIRCNHCEGKRRATNTKMLVSRNELKDLIRTIPFITIGKQFNVSDNAVRKWCDKYNLPRTKKEINSYSDEEWKLI